MIFLLGIALAMDSFAMSIINGLKYEDYKIKQALISAFVFGIFQGLMPLIGYYILNNFMSYIEDYDHYIVLIVLCILGYKMIKDSLDKDEIKIANNKFTYKILFFEAIATSIDALASGIYYTTISLNPIIASLIIFMETTIICLFGLVIGKRLKNIFKDKAGIIGGFMLIMIGIITVLEHIGII